MVQELEKSNKKIIMQNQRIQELMDKIDQKEDTINKFQNLKFHMENTCKGSDNVGNSSLIINSKLVCDETTEMSKDSKTKTYSGRKRLNEKHSVGISIWQCHTAVKENLYQNNIFRKRTHSWHSK